MAKRTVIFTFPKEFVEQPLAYRLIKEHNLILNILHAHIRPNEEGTLILEITGEEADIENGLMLVESTDVKIENLSDHVSWDKESCIHCTACIGQCPTHALSVNRDTMEVSFNPNECIACGICQDVCPMGVMNIEV